MSDSLTFPAKQASLQIAGASGPLELLTAVPLSESSTNATAIICHPHPQHGGTMHNKVVTTLHRSLQMLGLRTVRFNYRGVGQSNGCYDEGRGETDDLLAIMQWVKQVRPQDSLWLAGFSFGAYVSYRAATISALANEVAQLISVAPPIQYPEFPTLPTPHCPWVVVQGGKDEVVDAPAVITWANDKQPKPTLLSFPEAGHFFHGKLVDLKQRLIDTLAVPE